jgi:hypothetical protein
MATAYNTQQFLQDLGPCEINYDGVVLGKTATNADGGTHGGVNVRYESTVQDTMRDAEGANPHDSIITGQKMMVEANLAGMSIDQLASIFPNTTVSGSGTSRKLQIKNPVGTSMRDNAAKLILKPIISGTTSTDPTEWIVFDLAYPTPDFDFAFSLESQKTIKVSFTIFHDLTTNILSEWSYSA